MAPGQRRSGGVAPNNASIETKNGERAGGKIAAGNHIRVELLRGAWRAKYAIEGEIPHDPTSKTKQEAATQKRAERPGNN